LGTPFGRPGPGGSEFLIVCFSGEKSRELGVLGLDYGATPY
jgi:hypothetical protein